MKAILLFLSLAATAFAAPDPRCKKKPIFLRISREIKSSRFTCSECVDEMRNLGFIVRAGASDIRVKTFQEDKNQNFNNKINDNQDYLAANYCPSQNDEQFCVDYLARYYIGMLVKSHK